MFPITSYSSNAYKAHNLRQLHLSRSLPTIELPGDIDKTSSDSDSDAVSCIQSEMIINDLDVSKELHKTQNSNDDSSSFHMLSLSFYEKNLCKNNLNQRFQKGLGALFQTSFQNSEGNLKSKNYLNMLPDDQNGDDKAGHHISNQRSSIRNLLYPIKTKPILMPFKTSFVPSPKHYEIVKEKIAPIIGNSKLPVFKHKEKDEKPNKKRNPKFIMKDKSHMIRKLYLDNFGGKGTKKECRENKTEKQNNLNVLRNLDLNTSLKRESIFPREAQECCKSLDPRERCITGDEATVRVAENFCNEEEKEGQGNLKESDKKVKKPFKFRLNLLKKISKRITNKATDNPFSCVKKYKLMDQSSLNQELNKENVDEKNWAYTMSKRHVVGRGPLKNLHRDLNNKERSTTIGSYLSNSVTRSISKTDKEELRRIPRKSIRKNLEILNPHKYTILVAESNEDRRRTLEEPRNEPKRSNTVDDECVSTERTQEKKLTCKATKNKEVSFRASTFLRWQASLKKSVNRTLTGTDNKNKVILNRVSSLENKHKDSYV